MEQRTKIGYLVGGGLKENFRVRLTVSPQEMQEGAFVVIQSGEAGADGDFQNPAPRMAQQGPPQPVQPQ